MTPATITVQDPTRMKPAAEIREGLAQMYGTENYYKYLGGLRLTDGIKFLAESAACYWLLDIIFSYQPRLLRNERFQEFQLWELVKKPTRTYPNGWMVTCREDSDVKPAVSQRIPWSDFPLDEGIKIYVENGVILLPSEH